MTKRIEKMNIELAGNYADELKTLVSSLCEDIKDSESVTDAWNKIDRFYKDAESMRNKQKCTGSKSFSVLTDDVVSSEKLHVMNLSTMMEIKYGQTALNSIRMLTVLIKKYLQTDGTDQKANVLFH